jgi:hypothetical protein
MRVAYLQGEMEIEPDLFKEGRSPIYKNPKLMAEAKRKFLAEYGIKPKESMLHIVEKLRH